MKTNHQNYLLVFLLFIPNFLLANAGSPMIWFSFLHLIWINFIIGTFESKLLVEKFNLQNRKWLIIAANYISMFAGYYFIAPYFSLLNGYQDFWGMKSRVGEYELGGFFTGFLCSFGATLIIEFTFYWLSLRIKQNGWKLLKPFFVVNLFTNIIMLAIYFVIVAFGAKWN
ncbi:hypothetical protein EG359_05165 [Chryseobacterium joostei]|uniref:Uncharacterized protein n=1 Tax=Chryseobacterium joostei TaxID=112234 RepID=A0A1N7HUV5_9FLAO|nr:hypothetical protein [Chryseobacterium joostei]AZA99030.1 hypothetical protein EG359_05165 [Chryseobacterium joostei]SIS28605.1 hypothetical protein SAMN05421768_101329 [Chryseobacterium joostei]